MLKKIAFVAILLASAAFAQVSVGEHASFTFGTVWGEHTDDSYWGPGFTAGFDVKAPLDPKLSFVAGLEVDYRTITNEYKYRDTEIDHTYFFMYLRHPVVGRFYVDPKVFGEFGISAAVRLTSGNMAEGEDEDGFDVFSGVYDSSEDMSRFEFGLIAGLGFAVTPKVDFNIRYAMALTNMASHGNGGSKNMRFQAGLTYWFN